MSREIWMSNNKFFQRVAFDVSEDLNQGTVILFKKPLFRILIVLLCLDDRKWNKFS